MLLNFTNDNLTEYIKEENNLISNAISFLIKSEDTLLAYINNEESDINTAKTFIKQLNRNLENLDNLRTLLKKFQNSNNKILQSDLDKYNSLFLTTFNQILEVSSSIEILIQNTFKFKNNINEENNITDNKTLLISEKDNKVYLPYKRQNIENLLLTTKKYTTSEDVVNDIYTVPLSRYTHSASARFREGFNLMRKKESASFLKSVDFGLELFSKYTLNPAIITACQNLDELDIYLDCLENNNLDSFHIFNIKYEMNPIAQNNKNNFI